MQKVGISIHEPLLLDESQIPEWLYREVWHIRNNLPYDPDIRPYVEISLYVYETIRPLLKINDIMICVWDYYGKTEYFPYMSEKLYDKLELAIINDEQWTKVSRKSFDDMLRKYNRDMENQIGKKIHAMEKSKQ